jgi:hypothetical protein
MANWALVENNSVKQVYDNLPLSWKNISGLRTLENNLEVLQSLGWYPVTKQYQDFDTSRYSVDGYEHNFSNNIVIETYILKEKENNTEMLFEDKKVIFLQKLREERNKLLQESDWSQFPDVQNLFDEQTKEKWLKYRQELRDLPEIYSENQVVDLINVFWPELK